MRRSAFLVVLLSVVSAPALGSEADRLRRHFDAARAYLAERDLSTLTDAQRARRAARLADLEAYVARGVFPKNTDFEAQRAPYFVDDEGTRCAMAHLLETSGEPALVERVANSANNAYVYELAEDPELAAWLDHNGLTVDEAAMIQPTYGPVCNAYSECVCQRSDGSFGWGRPYAVLHVRVDDARVFSVHVLGHAGESIGVQVGETIEVDEHLVFMKDNGDEILIGYYDLDWQSGLGDVVDGELVACPYLDDESLRLDVDVAMEAIVADDCAERVVAASDAFAGDYGPDCGCLCTDTVRTHAPPTALFALLGVLLLRRRQAR